MTALIAVALMVGQAFPKSAAEVAGLYVIRRGFENVTVDLRADGSLTLTQEFDHPGGAQWQGQWSFVDQKLQVAIRYQKTKVQSSTWVPLVWGDRLMLVDQEEVREGFVGMRLREEADRLNRLGRRDEGEATLTRMAVRVKARDSKLPPRYGKIVASEEFGAYFADIDLRLPKTEP